MTENEQLNAIRAEVSALAHAMQTGVALDHQRGSQDGSPKHLRVGVNMALLDSGALVDLLIKKGIIGKLEYAEALRDKLEEEVEKYERELGVGLL